MSHPNITKNVTTSEREQNNVFIQQITIALHVKNLINKTKKREKNSALNIKPFSDQRTFYFFLNFSFIGETVQ